MYRTRNAACLQGYRGFESHPLRHRLVRQRTRIPVDSARETDAGRGLTSGVFVRPALDDVIALVSGDPKGAFIGGISAGTALARAVLAPQLNVELHIVTVAEWHTPDDTRSVHSGAD